MNNIKIYLIRWPLLVIMFINSVGAQQVDPKTQFFNSIKEKLTRLTKFEYSEKRWSKALMSSDTSTYTGKIIVFDDMPKQQTYRNYWVLDDRNQLIYGIEDDLIYYIIDDSNELGTRKVEGNDPFQALRGNIRSAYYNKIYLSLEIDSTLSNLEDYQYQKLYSGHKLSKNDTSSVMGTPLTYEKIMIFDEDLNLAAKVDKYIMEGDAQFDSTIFTIPQKVSKPFPYDDYSSENMLKKHPLKQFKSTPAEDRYAELKKIVGTTMDPIRGISNLNTKIATDSLASRYLLIDFWYKSCFPCMKAAPVLEKIKKRYTSKELFILGINTVDPPSTSLNKFIKNKKITYHTIFDLEKKWANKMEVKSYPTFFILDTKTHKVEHIFIGYSDSLENELVQKLDELLKN